MREWIAIAVCAVTLCVVTGLSFLFAVRHNPDKAPTHERPSPVPPPPTSAQPFDAAPTPAPPAEVPAATRTDQADRVALENRGRGVYETQGCATCHSISGVGNPRNPLDGTGSRWTPGQLRDWITGTGIAADQLSAAVIRRKQRYATLPDVEMQALIAYLSSLTEGAR